MKDLILFDVDGTLAESSKKVDSKIISKLKENKFKNYDLGLISGGKIEKLKNQIGIENISNEDSLFKYVFSENGMIGYKYNKKFFEMNLSSNYNEKDFIEINKLILDKCKIFIYNNDLIKLEKRNCMWYFSPCGVYCDDNLRKNFIDIDKKNNIRQQIILLLEEDLKKYNLTVKLGGNIGLAIHPFKWDKSYIIENNILDHQKYHNIYFFGDKCNTDGNDYPLYSHPRINGIFVRDPEDTYEKLCIF
tara:strand:+ start:415 stop:1155 length:741 start_codon:yes stop_codon:yes gene_type:complete